VIESTVKIKHYVSVLRDCFIKEQSFELYGQVVKIVQYVWTQKGDCIEFRFYLNNEGVIVLQYRENR
jgi:hypothetical protein